MGLPKVKSDANSIIISSCCHHPTFVTPAQMLFRVGLAAQRLGITRTVWLHIAAGER
jgi:hypothetical protein